MVVGYHRVVPFFYAKYRHGITSVRQSGKVFVFGNKTAFMPPGYPGGENLWAVAFQLIAKEKHGILDSFRDSFGIVVETSHIACQNRKPRERCIGA